MNRFLLAAACLLLTTAAGARTTIQIGDFSDAPLGEQPRAWRLAKLPFAEPTEFQVASIGGVRGVRMDARNAGAALYRSVGVDPATTPVLRWRWRVDQLVAGADIRRKQGDDLSARLYVMFDYPIERLPLLDQGKIRLARSVAGDLVPAAALCYVWDGNLPEGTTLWSPYSKRVRVVVVEQGDRQLGRWLVAERDVAADFRAAFGEEPPPITGIAIGADTDQTGGSTRGWFADIAFHPRREARSDAD
jgi:hypothetical protein